MIAIINYGVGNIHSVKKALEMYGAETLVTNKPRDIESADKIVLPGVGAFDDAISELKKKDLVDVLSEQSAGKKPLLGICLGMQLLFEESEEADKHRGLGILKGKVVRFRKKEGLKVPHMGWNRLKVQNPRLKTKCPLLKDIPDNTYVYFCHSYYPQPDNMDIAAAVTEYGINFVSVVWQDNVYGAQFHPEKSQKIGLEIIGNFVNLC